MALRFVARQDVNRFNLKWFRVYGLRFSSGQMVSLSSLTPDSSPPTHLHQLFIGSNVRVYASEGVGVSVCECVRLKSMETSKNKLPSA